MRPAVIVALLVVIALLPASRGQEVEPPDLTALATDAFRRGLSDPDRGVRFAAAQALGKTGRLEVVAALAGALRDQEWCVREQAAHSLRAFGERALPVFAEVLQSSDAGERLTAVKSLGHLGEAGLALLGPALRDPRERIRYVAVRALLPTPPDPAPEMILATLRGLLPARNMELGIEAARMLTDLGHGAEAVPTLLAGIREYRGVARPEVARILGRTGACGPEVAAALVEIVLAEKKDAYRLRTAIEEVLRPIGEPAAEIVEKGIGRAETDHHRYALERILRRIRERPPSKPESEPDVPAVSDEEFLARLVDEDLKEDEKRNAADILAAGFREPDITRKKLFDLLDEPAAAERAFDVLLAVEGGLPTSVEEALALLDSPGPAARRLGIRGLRALGGKEPQHREAVRALLDDPDEGVRACALWALEGPAPEREPVPTTPPPPDELVRRLSNPDLSVSLPASEALPRHGEAAAVPLAAAMASAHYGVLHYAEWIFMQLGSAGAGATRQLADLLGHEDVNVRETAARCLGEIGPGASPEVPGLLMALRDARISVRSRAAVALGRIGEEAAPALLEAAKDPDARVRASALFALGWIVGENQGLRQVPFEIRLPVAEPGPAAATGFVPTEEQFERARGLAKTANGRAARKLLADLPDEEAVAVLRAGLRLSEVRAAVICAAALSMEDLDAWEAERCVELLLAEVFRPDPPTGFYRLYEYLGSSEVAAMLGYLALSDLSDYDRTGVLGACHRIVRWDILPELYRIEDSADAWILAESSDVWFPRWWSDRYRDLEGIARLEEGDLEDTATPGEEGLPFLLRAVLRRGPPFSRLVNGWLNDSVPKERDGPLLLGLARKIREEGGNWESLTTLLRALGRLADPASEEFLLGCFADSEETGYFARAALARRGDPDALRRLREDAETDWLPLSLLMEVRPDIGAAAFRRQLLEGMSWAPCWQIGQEFHMVRWYGVRWPDGLFNGIEEAALAADLGPKRLALIAMMVPGCRTRRMADAILDGLPDVVSDLFEEYEEGGFETPNPELWWPLRNELFAFLHSADPTRVVALLRTWLEHPDPGPRRFALRALLAIGDPANASLLIERLGDWKPEYDDGEEHPVSSLSRSPSPETEAFLREAVGNPDLDENLRLVCLRELAILYGLPGPAAWPVGLDEEKTAGVETLAARVLEREPVQGVLEYLGGDDREHLDLHALGGLTGSAAAHELLRELAGRRGFCSYPKVLGQLARLGDEEARRELWSGIRAGRYRWICYQNDYEALTLGWDPATFPALLADTESNCCRGGHVARMFEELMGDDALGYSAHGQDAHPAKNAREWLRLYRGLWMRTPFPMPGQMGPVYFTRAVRE